MGISTTLDVVNEMLATLGEAPLNTLEEEHPLVPAALRTLALNTRKALTEDWWFTREYVTLVPDPITGEIAVPADALSIDPVKPYDNYVRRGRRLYDPENATYNIARTLKCRILRDIEFEDLPMSAAEYVSLRAQLSFNKAYDGDQTKIKLLSDDLRQARIILRAEHIRNIQANFLQEGGIAYKKQFIRGGTRYNR